MRPAIIATILLLAACTEDPGDPILDGAPECADERRHAYERGWDDALANATDELIYQSGYEDGLSNGVDSGYRAGYSEGFDSGWIGGVEAGKLLCPVLP